MLGALGRFLKLRYLILTGAIGGGVAANKVGTLFLLFLGLNSMHI